MGVKCFTCGKGFSGDTHELLLRFQRHYKEKGISRYFYKLETNGTIYTCRAEQLKHILETQIKPNFENGAEYSHITEYNPVA
jgi:DNA-directed RNA polymerase subunit N (RpoN/RPB10)